ncbi:MAG TPA: helix-turn-helix transcriptional regulator, partial [Atopobiaceae bacterium]|nr:helix-turn-helix transcriptional regulator [Atopobiaceae bacterium]
MPSQAQWDKLNEYLLQVGAYDDLIPFCVNALNRLRKVVSFDQGRVYLFDEDGCVFDEHLLGVSKKITKEYHEYYSGVDQNRYSAIKRLRDKARESVISDDEGIEQGMRVSRQEIKVMDWSREPHDTQFYRDHVSRLGLTYSTGFKLCDSRGRARVLFCIDRTRPVTFTADERATLSLVSTHLDNMCRKMFGNSPSTAGDTIGLMASGIPLTERERQICTMLMRGESPKSISEKLRISRRTVYKHVSNIHAKLGVTSQGELLAKLQESTV